MRSLDIQPNSPEWYTFRHKSIGASDIPVILGISQYKKRSKFLHEKLQDTHPKIKKNPITELGHQAEAELRPCVNKNFDLKLIPLTIQRDTIDDLHATVDGIDRVKQIIWECKLTGKLHYEQLKNNNVPPHFFSQIQFQLWMANYDQCVLSAIKFNPKKRKNFSENIHKVVERNDQFINEIIMPSIGLFRANLLALQVRQTNANEDGRCSE